MAYFQGDLGALLQSPNERGISFLEAAARTTPPAYTAYSKLSNCSSCRSTEAPKFKWNASLALAHSYTAPQVSEEQNEAI